MSKPVDRSTATGYRRTGATSRLAREQLELAGDATSLGLKVLHCLAQRCNRRERKPGIFLGTECSPKCAERGSVPASSERLRDPTNRLRLVLFVLCLLVGHRFDKRRDRSLRVRANVAEGFGRGRKEPAATIVGVKCNYQSRY